MIKWYIPYASLLNWDTASHIEIMKQWLTQNSLSKQHGHDIVLSLLAHSKLVLLHITQAMFI